MKAGLCGDEDAALSVLHEDAVVDLALHALLRHVVGDALLGALRIDLVHGDGLRTLQELTDHLERLVNGLLAAK